MRGAAGLGTMSSPSSLRGAAGLGLGLGLLLLAGAGAASALPDSPARPPEGNEGKPMRGVRLLTLVESEAGLGPLFEALGVSTFWSEHGQFTAEVPAACWGGVEAAVRGRNLTVARLVDDMQLQVDAELAARAAHPVGPGNRSLAESRPDFYAAFRNIEEIEERIGRIVAAAPAEMQVERFVYGTTHLGREMVGLRMRGRGTGLLPKFWQHGVQHGGEWITAMVCMYMAESLVAAYGLVPEVTRLLDSLEFMFAPVVNVDGFVHSWEGPATRNWRKSRQLHPANELALAECLAACEPDCGPTECSGCVGVDTNRNWGFEWGDEHASSNPCSSAYMGPAPYTEPEPQAVARFIQEENTPISPVLGAIDHHCCGDMWMTPWGWTVDLPDDYDAHIALGEAACAAIDEVHGRNYCARTGPIFTVISPATGCCTDFMYGGAGIVQSLATEMRSGLGSGASDGILENGQEMFAGVLVMAETLVADHRAGWAEIESL
eukprot:SAG22_NODE_2621_length_2366_cov_3.295986_1_plen_491_part_00